MAEPIKDGIQDPQNPVTPPVSDPSQIPTPPVVKPGEPVVPPVGIPLTEPAKEPAAVPGTVPHGAFHEERERRKASDARIEQIKALYGDQIKFDIDGNVLPPEPVGNQVPSPAMAGQDNVQSVSDVQKQVDEMWDTDPKKAVRTEIALALNWFDQQSAAVDLQRDTARTKFKDFSRYEGEINGYLRRLPLQQRTQLGIIDMAYNYVKGSKIDQILATERTEIARKLAAGEAVQGLTPGATGMPPVQPGAQTLTDDQRIAASAMGVSEEEYMKYVVTK